MRSRVGLRSPLAPIAVEGEAGEHEEEAEGRAAGAVEPDVEGEGECSGDEKARNPGIAPAAIGTGHVGFGDAEPEEGDDGKAVENPSSKNKEIG